MDLVRFLQILTGLAWFTTSVLHIKLARIDFRMNAVGFGVSSIVMALVTFVVGAVFLLLVGDTLVVTPISTLVTIVAYLLVWVTVEVLDSKGYI